MREQITIVLRKGIQTAVAWTDAGGNLHVKSDGELARRALAIVVNGLHYSKPKRRGGKR